VLCGSLSWHLWQPTGRLIAAVDQVRRKQLDLLSDTHCALNSDLIRSDRVPDTIALVEDSPELRLLSLARLFQQLLRLPLRAADGQPIAEDGLRSQRCRRKCRNLDTKRRARNIEETMSQTTGQTCSRAIFATRCAQGMVIGWPGNRTCSQIAGQSSATKDSASISSSGGCVHPSCGSANNETACVRHDMHGPGTCARGGATLRRGLCADVQLLTCCSSGDLWAADGCWWVSCATAATM